MSIIYGIAILKNYVKCIFLKDEDGHCVMRGVCDIDDVTLISKPCAYKGKPNPLNNSDAQRILEDLCPTLETGKNI